MGTDIETARRTVAGWSSGTEEWKEAVAQRIAATGEPLYHAAAVLRADDIAANGLRCSYCGERCCTHSDGKADHELCRVRLERGRTVVPIVYQAHCGCVRCGDYLKPDAWTSEAELRALWGDR